MAYLVKQRFNITDLADLPPRPKKHVLLVISEDCLREIYLRHFANSGFDAVGSHFADHATVARHLPVADLLVIDFGNPAEADKLEFLKILTRDFPQLPFVTVGFFLDSSLLAKLMAVGAASHVDRQFTRPTDLVEIARMILR